MTKDATVVSRQEDGTCTLSIEGVGVSSITVPAETFKPGHP